MKPNTGPNIVTNPRLPKLLFRFPTSQFAYEHNNEVGMSACDVENLKEMGPELPHCPGFHEPSSGKVKHEKHWESTDN